MKYTAVFRQKIIARPKFKKANLIVYFLLFLPIILLYRPYADSSMFSLLNTGRYILPHGITDIDPFTLHEGLYYPIQQWLSSVILYKVYSVGGFFFVYLTVLLAYFYTTMILYKLIVLLSEKNEIITYILTVVCNICLAFTIKAGAQPFSLAVIVTAIFLLEKAIDTGNKKFLFGLPILSILLINLHPAMWVFFILLLIPYIIDGLNVKNVRVFESITQHMRVLATTGYGVTIILFIAGVCFACGAVNPFGINSVTYALKAYANSNINSVVGEVPAPDFTLVGGKAIFLLYATIVFSHLAVRSKSRVRYMLMGIGTAYLGLISISNIPLFIVCTVPFIAFHIKDVVPVKRKKVVANHKGSNMMVVLGSLLLVAFVVFNYNSYDIQVQGPSSPVQMAEYIKTSIAGDIRLFNEHQTGDYLEFQGIKPFIDSRITLFSAKFNRSMDIIPDYSGIYSGRINVKELFDKYNLNYALVRNKSIANMQIILDDDFKVIRQDEVFCLYAYDVKEKVQSVTENAENVGETVGNFE